MRFSRLAGIGAMMPEYLFRMTSSSGQSEFVVKQDPGLKLSLTCPQLHVQTAVFMTGHGLPLQNKRTQTAHRKNSRDTLLVPGSACGPSFIDDAAMPLFGDPRIAERGGVTQKVSSFRSEGMRLAFLTVFSKLRFSYSTMDYSDYLC